MSNVSATGRVVIGVDGSAQSEQALRLAAAEATAHSATLEVVHAWNFLDQPGPTFDPEYGEDKARARATQIVDDVLGDDRPADVVITVINDHPAPALIQASEGALMVVVGARGLGGFKGMLLGSVSQHLVHNARCPVLLAR